MPMLSGICSAAQKPIFFGFYVNGVTLVCVLKLGGIHATISPMKARAFYGENSVSLPWQPFSQVTDAKLYNAIPRFAR